jgi:hypothetical protein
LESLIRYRIQLYQSKSYLETNTGIKSADMQSMKPSVCTDDAQNTEKLKAIDEKLVDALDSGLGSILRIISHTL